MFTSLLKGMIKDTDEWPEEGIHRVKSGRALNAGASTPRARPPPGMCSPSWDLPGLLTLGFYGDLLAEM